MRVQPIGEVIKARRMELGLTQEQLCEGICESFTLSRIENGKQSPSYSRMKALLQRLDLPDDRYTAVLDEEELKLEDLKREAGVRAALIWNASAQEAPRLREEALEAVRALEDFDQSKDPMVRQYTARFKAYLGTPEGPYSLEEQLALLLEAIRVTVPAFDLEDINRFRYSIEEMSLILRIAAAYAMAERRQEAIAVYEQVLEYAQAHGWDRPRYACHLILLLNNYARELDLDGQYEKTIQLARRGQDLCIKYIDYRCLGSLLSLQANAYAHLGDRAKSEALYYQTCHLYKALEDECGLAHLRNDARDTLGLQLA